MHQWLADALQVQLGQRWKLIEQTSKAWQRHQRDAIGATIFAETHRAHAAGEIALPDGFDLHEARQRGDWGIHRGFAPYDCPTPKQAAFHVRTARLATPARMSAGGKDYVRHRQFLQLRGHRIHASGASVACAYLRMDAQAVPCAGTASALGWR